MFIDILLGRNADGWISDRIHKQMLPNDRQLIAMLMLFKIEYSVVE